MAAICYILHDLQPVFLVKNVKATLLSDILSDPFTSTEQICLNLKTQSHAVKYVGVLHHIYPGSNDGMLCRNGLCSKTQCSQP